MASTVNTAFEEFLKNSVRLDSTQAAKARISRDNLISNINGFSGDDDFFSLYKEKHLKYGSFARNTKIRPIDDIDLMICISGEGRKYSCSGSTYYITGLDSDYSNNLMTGTSLNSTKVINRFLKKLGALHDYRKAEMHKNHEAATLQLMTYDWNFDIVPCWSMDIDKYLIPDGNGNWKITDPRIDNNRTMELNQKHKGKMLDVIRLMKYWNNRAITLKIDSYLLECMVLEVYQSMGVKDNYWVDLEFRDLLNRMANIILSDVQDPKGIQGNINKYSFEDRVKISVALTNAYNKAKEATSLELTKKDQRAAINKWREVLGPSFPQYTD